MPAPTGRDRRVPFRPMAQLTVAVLLLWTTFYILGQALLLIPSEFHDTYDTTLEDLRALEAETNRTPPPSPPPTPGEVEGAS